jgi:serine/threonine protein kinase
MRYELLERIGAGGMAEIFRGRAVAEGGFEKPVAIKRILPSLSRDARFVEMLITEANTLAQLRHRNIVQIFDVGLGPDGQYFLVMEFVDGLDLGRLFEALERRGKRLPTHLALHIAAEVCDALQLAHGASAADGSSLRLVHRDVSPSNVLLSRSGEVKLTDFGIAKRTEEVTGHGTVRGKFAYISPEQARNESVDGRSDVFSLGIVLYELCTGRRLFSRYPDFEALHAVRERPIPSALEMDPHMDPALDALIMRALARPAAERYPSAGAFGAALRDYRYTALSSAGEPAKELARILRSVEESAGPASATATPGYEVRREPTIVRIKTAAGFTIASTTPSSTPTAGPVFADEETRTASPGEIEALLAAQPAEPDVEDPTHRLEIGQLRTASSPGLPDVEAMPDADELLFGLGRRVALLLGAALAALLAVGAFVVAGDLLATGDAIAPADAAPGPTVELPADEIRTGVAPDEPPQTDKKARKRTRDSRARKDRRATP